MAKGTLTENQHEVLAYLKWAREKNQGCREMDGGIRYCTPMDVGGSNGSHHAGTLLALSKKGLVHRHKFRGFGPRGSCCYRITDAGVELLANITATQQAAR